MSRARSCTWRGRRTASISVIGLVLLTWAAPAIACDFRQFQPSQAVDAKAHAIGPVAATVPAARIGSASFAIPQPGHPQQKRMSSLLTRNPDTPLLFEPGFTTPADPCAPPVCSEVTVNVPKARGARTLYARAQWPMPNYYVHIWGISPEPGPDRIVGQAEVAQSFNKETGNERTIPVSEFHVANPAPGAWRIQTRAVFGVRIPVTTTVSLAAGNPVAYPRIDVRALADRYLTQKVAINIVFAGRDWSKEQIEEFRSRMPTEYRTGVLTKQASDCAGENDHGSNLVLNWKVCHFSGTQSPNAEGARPYFEPIKFNYDYHFLQADRDLDPRPLRDGRERDGAGSAVRHPGRGELPGAVRRPPREALP